MATITFPRTGLFPSPARRGDCASGSNPRSAACCTGLGLNEAVTFSLVDEALSVPVGPGSGPPPLADRAFQPQTGGRVAAEPDSQPAGGSPP